MADHISETNHFPENLLVTLVKDPFSQEQMAGFLGGLGVAVVLIHGDMLDDIDEMVDDLEKIIFYNILGDGILEELFQGLPGERFDFSEMFLYFLDPPRKDQSIDHAAKTLFTRSSRIFLREVLAS